MGTKAVRHNCRNILIFHPNPCRFASLVAAIAEWRCSTGDGPVDQIRTIFEVRAPMLDIYHYVRKERRYKIVLCENEDGTDDLHMVTEMPFPLATRESIVRRQGRIAPDGLSCIDIVRSASTTRGVRLSALRVLAKVSIGGFFMEKIGPRKTRVSYIVGVDLGGMFALDWMARRSGPVYVKKIVNEIKTIADTDIFVGFEQAGRQNSEVNFGSLNPMRGVDGVEKKRQQKSAIEMTEMGKQDGGNSKPPPLWIKHTEEKTGYDYFENLETGQTSWEKPEGWVDEEDK